MVRQWCRIFLAGGSGILVLKLSFSGKASCLNKTVQFSQDKVIQHRFENESRILMLILGFSCALGWKLWTSGMTSSNQDQTAVRSINMPATLHSDSGQINLEGGCLVERGVETGRGWTKSDCNGWERF